MSMKTRRMKWLTRLAALAAASLGAVASGCVNTDTAIFVDAGIDGPSLTVAQGPLGSSMSGAFTLTLHLGARAAGASDVTFGTFNLEKADRSAVIVDGLPVSSSTASPVGVEPDTTVEVDFVIDSGADPLDMSVIDQICAGDVVISGTIDDSLADKQTPVVSDAFSALGCAGGT
jgi:hypothetical protein